MMYDWLWLGGAALLGLFIGTLLCGQSLRSQLSNVRLDMASDRELALCTLRRELANYMVRRDPDRFFRLYREARAADIAIGNADKASQKAQLAAITEKYRFYQDFDFVSTREHVLYADALNSRSLEEIEAHYLTIVKFHSLQRALDKDWRDRPMAREATSDSDLKHLEEYVQEVKDTKFWQRLRAAVGEFFAHSHDDTFGGAQGSAVYETDVLAVYRIYHFAETRYGFHFKDTNEFGLYGSFHDRDKTHQHFYRSDRKFEAEIYLDHLHIDEPI